MLKRNKFKLLEGRNSPSWYSMRLTLFKIGKKNSEISINKLSLIAGTDYNTIQKMLKIIKTYYHTRKTRQLLSMAG